MRRSMPSAPSERASVRPSETSESGTPGLGAARPAGADELDGGRAGGSPAGAGIAALLQIIEQATSGVSGGHEANEHLAHELRALRQMLTAERLGLERRVTELSLERDALERELEELRIESIHAREFLLDEQDRFLNGVLEDHEQVLAALIRERDEANARLAQFSSEKLPIVPIGAPRSASEDAAALAVRNLEQQLAEARSTIEKLSAERERGRDVLRRLQSQRDDAQEQAGQLALERDRAHSELAVLRAARRETTPAIPNTAGPSSRPPGAEDPNAALDANRAARRTDPMTGMAKAPERPTFPAPPWALDRQIEMSRPSPVGIPKADPVPIDFPPPIPEADPVIETKYPVQRQPPLKKKPDPTSSPLGVYSIASEEITPERIEPANHTSKPPQR